jgi:hypothetical protein
MFLFFSVSQKWHQIFFLHPFTEAMLRWSSSAKKSSFFLLSKKSGFFEGKMRSAPRRKKKEEFKVGCFADAFSEIRKNQFENEKSTCFLSRQNEKFFSIVYTFLKINVE